MVCLPKKTTKSRPRPRLKFQMSTLKVSVKYGKGNLWGRSGTTVVLGNLSSKYVQEESLFTFIDFWIDDRYRPLSFYI